MLTDSWNYGTLHTNPLYAGNVSAVAVNVPILLQTISRYVSSNYHRFSLQQLVWQRSYENVLKVL